VAKACGAAGLPAETPKEWSCRESLPDCVTQAGNPKWSCRESNPGPEKMNVYVLHA